MVTKARVEKLRSTGDLANSPANTEARLYLSSAVCKPGCLINEHFIMHNHRTGRSLEDRSILKRGKKVTRSKGQRPKRIWQVCRK